MNTCDAQFTSVTEFDSRLDEHSLKKLINFVCVNFDPESDWPVMTKYLRAIADLERFNIIISFVDFETENGKDILKSNRSILRQPIREISFHFIVIDLMATWFVL